MAKRNKEERSEKARQLRARYGFTDSHSQGQILAVWILAAKLPNSDLNFAVDFWVVRKSSPRISANPFLDPQGFLDFSKGQGIEGQVSLRDIGFDWVSTGSSGWPSHLHPPGHDRWSVVTDWAQIFGANPSTFDKTPWRIVQQILLLTATF